MKRLVTPLALAGTLAVVLGLTEVFAQRVQFASQNTALLIPSLAGQDLFAFYCASCHGSDAKGTGPMATVLKTPPPDLTRLALRNNGNFPRERVVQFVGGGGSNLRGSHGSNEMPVWGPIFKALDPSDERLVLLRLDNIVRYLESIQVK